MTSNFQRGDQVKSLIEKQVQISPVCSFYYVIGLPRDLLNQSMNGVKSKNGIRLIF